jgi:transposase
MGRNREAPFGFVCEYRNACPHLGGISATWANILIADKEEDHFRDGHLERHAEKELRTLEVELEKALAENDRLKAENTRLHKQQFKANRRKVPADMRNDADGKAKEKKKRGPPRGHPAWNRKPPDHINKIVNIQAPKTCPHCHCSKLSPSSEQKVCVQEDIILQPKTYVTKFIHDTALCPECRRPVFQTAPGELRNSTIGPVTKATAVFLRYEVKLSYRDIRKVFSSVFGMSFVPASAMNFDRQVAALGRPLHEDLRYKVRASHIAHADETSWRIDGHGAQLWYAGNVDTAFYLVDPSRGGDVAVSIFGEDWPGNLVADSYPGYNPVNPASRQACLAHVATKAKEIAKVVTLLPANRQDEPSLRFCDNVRLFVKDACKLGKARNSGRISFKKAKKKKGPLQRRLNTICSVPLADPDAENLRARITDPKRDGDRILTFLDVNGMEPTNNHAEQSLRLPVIFRKICFGSRSVIGAETLSTNLSLITTSKRQGRNPRPFLQTLLLNGPAAAQHLLYHNPPANTS